MPLLCEGTARLAYKNLEDHEVQSLCELELRKVKKQYGTAIMAIMEQSHVTDNWSNELLDKNMCTDTCPCLEYTTPDGKNSKEVFMNEEALLRDHNRIFVPNSDEQLIQVQRSGQRQKFYNGSRIMVYTKDEAVGFRSMQECLEHYEFR